MTNLSLLDSEFLVRMYGDLRSEQYEHESQLEFCLDEEEKAEYQQKADRCQDRSNEVLAEILGRMRPC